MIEVEGIHKSFAGNHVLRGVNFTVPSGCVTALVGPNGAGKSTTIRILTGCNDSDLGTVRINGEVMSVHSVQAKNLVGYAPENAPSYRESTVIEFLSFIGELRGIKHKALIEEVARVMEAFSLQRVAGQAIGTLSKGYRHRVSLAQCLLGDPPVIILDEPTDGLDPLQKIETRKIITELAKTKAVLLTTHLLEEVEMLCDHVVILAKGQVDFSGTMAQVHERIATNNRVQLRVIAKHEINTAHGLVNAKSAINSISGISDVKLQQQASFIQGEIYFEPLDNRDILDEVSNTLDLANFRVVELSQVTPDLHNMLSG